MCLLPEIPQIYLRPHSSHPTYQRWNRYLTILKYIFLYLDSTDELYDPSCLTLHTNDETYASLHWKTFLFLCNDSSSDCKIPLLPSYIPTMKYVTHWAALPCHWNTRRSSRRGRRCGCPAMWDRTSIWEWSICKAYRYRRLRYQDLPFRAVQLKDQRSCWPPRVDSEILRVVHVRHLHWSAGYCS